MAAFLKKTGMLAHKKLFKASNVFWKKSPCGCESNAKLYVLLYEMNHHSEFTL